MYEVGESGGKARKLTAFLAFVRLNTPVFVVLGIILVVGVVAVVRHVITADQREIEYFVNGEGRGEVVYSDQSGIVKANVILPWSQRVTLKGKDTLFYVRGSITAGYRETSCSVFVDGTQVMGKMGTFGIAECAERQTE